jgi:hypothetical protein
MNDGAALLADPNAARFASIRLHGTVAPGRSTCGAVKPRRRTDGIRDPVAGPVIV